MTKSQLKGRDNYELVDELLGRFGNIDHKKLLRDMLAECFMWMKFGNKREERMACDFLNEIQTLAGRQKKLPSFKELGVDGDSALDRQNSVLNKP